MLSHITLISLILATLLLSTQSTFVRKDCGPIKKFTECKQDLAQQLETPLSDEEEQEVHQAALALDQMYEADKKRFQGKKRSVFDMCIKAWGHYCGPGYCDGSYWDDCDNSKGYQGKCNFEGSLKDKLDGCCRQHDKCCVNNRGGSCKECRTEMVRCLDKLNVPSLSGQWMTRELFLAFFKNRSGCC